MSLLVGRLGRVDLCRRAARECDAKGCDDEMEGFILPVVLSLAIGPLKLQELAERTASALSPGLYQLPVVIFSDSKLPGPAGNFRGRRRDQFSFGPAGLVLLESLLIVEWVSSGSIPVLGVVMATAETKFGPVYDMESNPSPYIVLPEFNDRTSLRRLDLL